MDAEAIELRPAKALVPYARNPRTHTKEQIAQLAASLRRFRWTNPVLVDEADGIVAGHGRVLAAHEIYKKGEAIKTVGGGTLPAGMVPVIVARGWSEDDKRAYVIADNQLALNAGWDADLLRLEIGELRSADYDIGLLGFSDVQLTDIFGEGSERYSKKLEAPIYEPRGDLPALSELADASKAEALKAEVRAAGLPAEVARFLEVAADRHTVFNFHRIADYYARAPAEVQRLFERSALVIIDFDAAIENGFVKLTDRMRELIGEMDARDPG